MRLAIQKSICLSPANFPGDVLDKIQIPDISGGKVFIREPDFKKYIPLSALRRMGKSIKMGVYCGASLDSEGSAGAIVVGTGLGGMEDGIGFLGDIVENGEKHLTPTKFMQATHNNIASQIGYLAKNHGHNNTHVHRGFSFENALLEARLLLAEGLNSVLVGGVDEITPTNYNLYRESGMYKSGPSGGGSLFETKNQGTIAGEGAAFFLLGGENKKGVFFRGAKTIYKPRSAKNLEPHLEALLLEAGIERREIQLLLCGKNGDSRTDGIYDSFAKGIPGALRGNFKHLCGEYHTAVSFGMWLADRILRSQKCPPEISETPPQGGPITNILIYNHYRNINHSLLLLGLD